MKRGIISLLVTFIGFIVFGVMGNSNGSNAEIYKNIMTVFGLLFFGSLLYTAYKVIIFLKRKTVEKVKKGISSTTYGKKNDLRDIIRAGIFAKDIAALKAEVQSFVHEKGMDDASMKQAVKNVVPLVIEDALDDGIFSEEEQQSIDAFLDVYGLAANDIDEKGRNMLVRGALIRDLLEGVVKPRIDASSLPFKPVKGEVSIWGYDGMTVAEIRQESQWQGGSQGVSFRVAKGVYWRVGKAAAQRVTTEAIRDLGSGVVFITSHHLYYHVGNKSERIKHDKIFNIAKYSDAVVVHREGASKKPLVLKTDDTWFLANILQNAQNWS